MTQRPYRGRRVDNGEEVRGWYFEHKGKAYIIPANIRILPLRYMEGPRSMDGFIEVHPASVSQSTGIPDKHGQEIYGGMKVRFEGYVGDFFEDGRREMLIGEVFYKTEGSVGYCFKVGNSNYGLNSNDVDIYEIIPEGEEE